jgi:hypothetical protein
VDVIECGFVLRSEKSATWLKIGGILREIATTERPLDVAFCLHCETELKARPVDLLRVA